MKRIIRHEVEADDKNHEIILTGDPGAELTVVRIDEVVVFWAPWNDDAPTKRRKFRVVLTEQQLPDNVYRWWGTAITSRGNALHLVELRG